MAPRATPRHARPYGIGLPERLGQFSLEPDRGRRLDREQLIQYWHPDRLTVEPCPERFARQVRDIHVDLRVVRSPVHHSWLVWYRKSTVTHPLCPGWLLLLDWRSDKDNRPLPLDNRLLANIYLRDARRFGNGKKYFLAVATEIERSKAKSQAAWDDERHARSRDYHQYRKIKNIGAGSKFPFHHDGGVVPSPGEARWWKDTAKWRMPNEPYEEMCERMQVAPRGRAYSKKPAMAAVPAHAFDIEMAMLNRILRREKVLVERARPAERPRERTLDPPGYRDAWGKGRR